MPRIPIWQVITVILMITWTTLLPACAQASVPKDKWLHAGAGAGLGASGYYAASWVTDEPWLRALAGFTLGTTAGAVKEWADYHGSGDSSAADFAATFAGTAIAVGIAVIWDQLSTYKEKEKPSNSVLPSDLNHETPPKHAVYQKHLRMWPSDEPELSQRISRHALQTRSPVPSRLSPALNHCTLHGPCRTVLQYQLFLY